MDADQDEGLDAESDSQSNCSLCKSNQSEQETPDSGIKIGIGDSSVNVEESYVDCQTCGSCSIADHSCENEDISDNSSHICDIVKDSCDFSCDNYWPLVWNSNVIVNLLELSRDKFKCGDLNLFVKLTESDNVVLCVKYQVGISVDEIEIPESQFGQIFTMDWKDEIVSGSTNELGEDLKYCLASLEDSIERLRWQEVVPKSAGFRHGNHGDVKMKNSCVHVKKDVRIHDDCNNMKNIQNGCTKSGQLSTYENYSSYCDSHKRLDKNSPCSSGQGHTVDYKGHFGSQGKNI